MPQTIDTLATLRKFADLDVSRRRLPADAPGFAGLSQQIEEIRKRLPAAVLTHYDLRRSRGKSAVAPARGGICGGCHLSLPSGLAAELRRGGSALHICTNCGSFIFLDDAPVETAPAIPPAAVAPVKKPRKKKVAVETAAM